MPTEKRGRRKPHVFDNQEYEVDEESEEGEMDIEHYDWSGVTRAEKSRLAAKDRRDREVEELANLAQLLPFDPSVTAKLDKGAILRLTIDFFRMKSVFGQDQADKSTQRSTPAIENKPLARDGARSAKRCRSEVQSQAVVKAPKFGMHLDEGELMLDAMDGFLLLVNRSGRVLYVSDNVEKHLGVKQVDVLGHNVCDDHIIHRDDFRELQHQMTPKAPNQQLSSCMLNCNAPECFDDEDEFVNPETFVRHRAPFYIRMRYSITKEGTKMRHSGYMLTHWQGRLKLEPVYSTQKKPKRRGGVKTPAERPKLRGYRILGMVAVVRPMQNTSSILEIRMDGNMFMSRHNLDMTFTFCDTRILTLVGYEPDELIGKTAYHFHNPLDADKIKGCHSNLIHKGTSVSKYYRFLGKTGEWVWMQTRATIIFSAGNRPQYVVCMNYVIGQNEGRRHLMMDLASTGLMSEAESFKGAIDESAIPPSPPGSKISSGYGSDDDHIYCVNSRTQSQDTTPTLSLSNTPPQTPPAGQLLQQQPPLVESMDVMLASPNDCSGSQRGGRCMGNLDDLQELMSLLESSANSDPWGTSDSMEIDPVEPSNSDLADPKILLGLLTEAKKFCDDQQMVPGDMLLSPGASSCNSAELTPPSDVSSAQTSPLRVTSPPAGEAMPLSLALLQEQSSPQTANAASPLQQQASPSSALSIGLTTLPSRSLDSDGNLLQGTDEMPLKFPQSENVEMVNTSIASYLGQGIQELQTSVPSSLNCSPSPQDQLLQLNAEQALAMDCCNAGSNSTPLVGGNPFLVDTAQHVVSAPQQQQQQQQPMLLVTRSTPPTLSTPTTMYIPTTTGMSSVKLPQTPLNKTSSISLLTPTAKRSLPNGQQRMKPLAIRVPLTASQRPQQQSWPLNPCPKASSLAFRNDHPYTSKQPEGSSTHAAKHKHRNHNHSSHSAMRLSSSSSVLETLLTTTKQLNPNDGSEKVLAAEGIQMTSSSSRAAFQQQLQQEEDAMAPLLKKLLTGEMNQREVHKDEQQVIDDRKGTLDPLTSDPFGLDLNVEGLSSLDDTDGGGIDLGLLGAESQGNRIWTPSSPCHDLMSSEMSSELAEILQEQTRQDDLWLQSYLDHTNL